MTRKEEYYELISRIPQHKPTKPFLQNGKLIICLIEFRTMPSIEHVMNAVLSLYNPDEIGIAVVYGINNSDYVENLFKDWQGMKLIKTQHGNLTRGDYSALCLTPEIWENFTDFSHVLVYQTDALICGKIDDQYFQYDYIGAPWTVGFRVKNGYLGGNGGFSLRNIQKSIEVCEQFRNIPFSKIPRENEDIFYCRQPTFTYPDVPIINGRPKYSDIHKKFSAEKDYYPEPIGMHQIYGCAMGEKQWEDMKTYIEKKLIHDTN